jgi:uncharacterized protein (UPF0335 family)
MNTTTAIGYRDRIILLLQEIAERREDIREICTEMRSRGLSDVEIAAVRTAASKALWDQRKRERQETIGQYLLQLETASVSQAAD